MPRLLLALFLFAFAALAPACAAEPVAADAAANKAPPLRVAHWGGAYGAAVSDIILKAFTNRTGIEVIEVPYEGGIEGLDGFDVVDLTGEDAAAACAQGLITAIDPAGFAAGSDQTPAAKDFASTLPCAAPATLTAELLIFGTGMRAARTPHGLTDLFDLAGYPGKRGLKRDPMGLVELALIADGVPTGKVYETLATQDGIERAFAKLDTIRHEVVWWDEGDMPATLVGRGEAVMSTAYNTRAYAALVSGAEIGAVWRDALVHVNGWGVTAFARDQKAALELVKFATDSARLAQLGETIPYGPARRSALSGMSPEMRAFSPAAPEHLENAFVIDAAFWAKSGEGLRNRFELWLAETAKDKREARARAE